MRKLWGACLAACLVACSPSFEEGAEVESRDWTTSPAQAPSAEPVEVAGAVRALAVHEDAVLFGTEAGAFLQRGADAPLPAKLLRLSDDEPAGTGAIRQITSRGDEGLLIAAEHGLYLWNGRVLSRSPLSDVAGSPTAVAAGSFSGEERLVFVSGGKLFVAGNSVREITPGWLEGTPEQVATWNGTVFASAGDRISRLVERGETFDEFPIQVTGKVQALVIDTTGALWVATSEAVLRRTEQFGQIAWQEWVGIDARALAIDPDGAGTWVRWPGFAGRIDVGASAALVVPLAGHGPLAMDFEGSLWAAHGASPILWRQSGVQAPAPSFATSVEAFSRRHCSACHNASAALPLIGYDDWKRNSQRILLNLEVGTMPQGAPLSRAEYRVVERWVLGGMLP